MLTALDGSIFKTVPFPAPFDGSVGLRTISYAACVEPGDAVATMDDRSVMKLDFRVPSIYLATIERRLRLGQRGSIGVRQ